ncbi:hypothetical protein MNB_SV-12-57 [hydrothermal vent metagenome]|uniref:Uncharacterized protein n=1 Tax=hydrothermal vent metagenome TaxID=652676 RepID=A0A1W1C5K1_9ZZZZ
MKKKNEIVEKEELLNEIEVLMRYKKEDKMTINPNYLEYLEVEDLKSIKQTLLKRVGKLSKENIEWLEQFKKY